MAATTQLQLGGWVGMPYGDFSGRSPAATGSYRYVGKFSGKAVAQGTLTHLAGHPAGNAPNAPATSQDTNKDIFISRHF